MPLFNARAQLLPMEVAWDDYRIAALEAMAKDGYVDTWATQVLTYSFPRSGSSWEGGGSYGKGEIGQGWVPLNSTQQDAVRKALATWAAVANITFTEVSETSTTVGDLRFAFTYAVPNDQAAYAYPPMEEAKGGDVWLKAGYSGESYHPSANGYDHSASYEYLTLIHEIGHALGLSHPFAEDGTTRGTAPLSVLESSTKYTVMAYQHNLDPDPTTPMVFDALAIQRLYGANYSYRTGNDSYTFDIGDVYTQSLWDAGGTDTIVVTDRANMPYIEWSESLKQDAVLWTQFQTQFQSLPLIDLRPGVQTQPAGGDIPHNPLSVIEGSAADRNLQTGDGFGLSVGLNFTSIYMGNTYGRDYRNAYTTVYLDYGTLIENAVGSHLPEVIVGQWLDNTFMGNGGGDYIEGNGGTDTAIYRGFYSEYSISRTATRTTVTDHISTRDGADVLQHVERLRFVDKAVAFDVEGNAGKAYRLYQAAFDRKPDLGGLGYQMNALDMGFGLQVVARSFLASPEFQSKYGALDNTHFVTQLYANVLHRAPDAGGLAFHLNNLEHGVSRSDVLVGFSESPENQAQVLGSISAGMFYIPVA